MIRAILTIAILGAVLAMASSNDRAAMEACLKAHSFDVCRYSIR